MGNRLGIGVTGGEGGKGGMVWEGPSGLPDVGSFGAGDNGVTCPATVRAETGVRPATAFLEGEWAAGSSGAIKLHGVISGGGRGLTGGGGWVGGEEGGCCGGSVAAGGLLLLLLGMGAGEGGSKQGVLNEDGCNDISLESGGY